MVQSYSDSKNFVLTTGHCFADVSLGPWYSPKTANHTGYNIGYAHNYRADTQRYTDVVHDYGIAYVSNTANWGVRHSVLVASSMSTVNGTTYTTSRDEDYAISGVANAGMIPNGYVCKTGATSGTTCGPYVAINSISHMAMVNYTSCGGDSGSPIYIAHTGFGLHESHDYASGYSGTVGNVLFWTNSVTRTVDCYSAPGLGTHGWSNYQGLNEALTSMNVHLLP